MKKILGLLVVFLLVLLGICLFRSMTLRSIQPGNAFRATMAINNSVVVHFQQGLQFQTVSYDSLPTDSLTVLAFHRFLEKTYPRVFQLCEKHLVDGYTLILHWKGKAAINDSPVVLMAHQDVVPVESGSLQDWKAPPFAGKIIGDTLYGRGAVDDKMALLSILEAAEKLIGEGFVPARDIYFVFGHNEETTGTGATAAVDWFEKQGIHPKWVFDEGGEITASVPGIPKQHVALIGTSEKGYLTVQLQVSEPGGHSSMPAPSTAIDRLCAAIQKLRADPFKASFNPSMNDFLHFLGPEMSPATRFFVANRWLFDPLLLKIYAQSPPGNALIRTTIAPTLIAAGTKENVIPNIATATINLRLAPGIDTQQVLDHLRHSIQDDRVAITVVGVPRDASHVTDFRSEGFQVLATSIRENYRNILVAPFLMIGGTDGRKFERICRTVIRFCPATDLKGMHGINERVGVQELKNGIGLYYRVMKNVR